MKTVFFTPRFYRLTKEGSWIISGQIASILGSLMLVRVLTEYLEPEQYGQLALGLTAAGLVNQIVMGGMSNGISRYYSIAVEKKDLSGYMHASSLLMGYATAVVVAVALVLMLFLFLLDYTHWMGLVAAALLFSILSGYNLSLSSIQNAARQRAIVAFHRGAEPWFKILLAIGVMLLLENSSTAAVIGYALTSLLMTSSQLFFLNRLIHAQSGKSVSSDNWGRQIWSYSWPFCTWGVFTWAQQASDRWALQSFASTQEVGLYAVVFQIGYTPIVMASGLAMTFLGPILFQRSGSAKNHVRNISVHRIAWRITFVGLIVTALAFVIAISLHEWIFDVLVATKYHSVSNFLPWMVLAGGIFAAAQTLSLKLMSEMRPTVMTTAKIVTAILGIALNIYGASRFGMAGVVAALVMFSGIYLLWMIWLTWEPPVFREKQQDEIRKIIEY